ncbi:MAG: M20/M25/M40 family metallo-hydrolase, partial [Oscillospiraceae bacterium]|nr:M20/M25/M40 family metallo-hydrolase [Oscillospiraceae bacterium]
MNIDLSAEALEYATSNHETLVELTKTLCGICAPSNHEEKRAEFCKQWLLDNGVDSAYIDEACNVVCPINCEGSDKITVFMAHTDTVFPDTEPMPLIEADGKLCCPGVGDDTVNLAMLMLCTKYVFAHRELAPKDGAIYVMNSGEEGLGNLRGSRHIILNSFKGRIKEFYSFDGGYDLLCNAAVGSIRYRVEVKTEGGHSYSDFGNRNAIAYLAALIQNLYNAPVPKTGSRTSFNVGKISGGTSVNTIAQQAEMLFEYRSDIRENLEMMKDIFNAAVESTRKLVSEVNVEVLGERPCAGEVDPGHQKMLDDKAVALLDKYCGVNTPFTPNSTDCNIPLSVGI